MASSGKNWKHISIVLAGMLVGVIVLAFWQIKSNKIFGDSEKAPVIFEYGSKTYVQFDHPLVYLTVVTVDDCKDVEVCNTKAVIEEIRRNVTYGLVMREVSESSEEGQKLISDLSVRYLPAYLFGKNLSDVPTFADLQTKSDIPYFTDLGDYYVLNYAARTEPAKYMANNFEYFPEELDAETGADAPETSGNEEVSNGEKTVNDQAEDKETVDKDAQKKAEVATPKDDDAAL